MKRSFDLLVASAALLALAPVLAVLAVLVASTSRGGALFRQQRVGRGGRRFTILKFRTMTAGESGSPAVTVSGDTRVTRVGHLLRASKLDELPQLINVVRGDMSLVGPRPEVPQYVDLWPADLSPVILSVRPGITDPASIEFRHESELLARQPDPQQYYETVLLPRKAQLYAEYVENRTLLGDLRVLGRTFVSVVSRS